MKLAKRRIVERFTFPDGSTAELDAIEVSRKVTSQLERMAAINSYIGDETSADRYRKLASVERWRQAKREQMIAQPRRDQVRAISADGGKATAAKYSHPELDDLIRGCLRRGEKTRPYTKEWALAFRVSVDVVERHIKKIKKEGRS